MCWNKSESLNITNKTKLKCFFTLCVFIAKCISVPSEWCCCYQKQTTNRETWGVVNKSGFYLSILISPHFTVRSDTFVTKRVPYTTVCFPEPFFLFFLFFVGAFMIHSMQISHLNAAVQRRFIRTEPLKCCTDILSFWTGSSGPERII